MANIYNKFVQIGTYAKPFKIGKVSAFFKRGDKTDADNYRPITVLTYINKILEKLIHLRLSNFLQENNILSEIESEIEDSIFE